MSFEAELKLILESSERESVGKSFGGNGGKKSFSVAAIRDWIANQTPFSEDSHLEAALYGLHRKLPAPTFSSVIASAIRFSFLIELTDLKVGSTKFKTRWLPGLILMPQAGSFEPIQGSFEPGNDPRAAPYSECLHVFQCYCLTFLKELARDRSLPLFIDQLAKNRRVPYEFPFGYRDPHADPVHHAQNVRWILNEDLRWLVRARSILKSTAHPHKEAIERIGSKKLQVKVYKTDRALTGKDKTNRAKRWEVLAGDFQHATLDECWSVERKLISDLVRFDGFPISILERFQREELADEHDQVTRCPVTLAPLDYMAFADSVLKAKHGRSDYQIGHLNPLKRGGRHTGSNICWQSADGNRIQGDLTIDETTSLLAAISTRRLQLHPD